MARFLCFLFFVIALATSSARAQFSAPSDFMNADDYEVGSGDIFSDFNEELEDSKTVEDERFFHYGRFFALNFSLGHTTFTGERGSAYDDQDPSYGLSVVYFFNFNVATILGFEYSKHSFFLDPAIKYHGYTLGGPGMVDVSMFRTFMGFRYYIDTFDLGTAITYANPYFVGRMEYWNQSNTFADLAGKPKEAGGSIGSGLGFGLEFPIELKAYYFGVEFLYHTVNFFDKYTQNYRPVSGSTGGYDDLSGNVYTLFLSYTINW